METDLTQSEANLVWAASGFRMDRSVPFANLIRQMVMFTHDEKHAAVKQCKNEFFGKISMLMVCLNV